MGPDFCGRSSSEKLWPRVGKRIHVPIGAVKLSDAFSRKHGVLKRKNGEGRAIQVRERKRRI